MDSVTARALLGVHSSADVDEIKRAFRRRARSAHPDLGGSDADFRRLLDAQRLVLADVTSARSRVHANWVTTNERRPKISIVDAPRPRRRSGRVGCTEAGSPERSFGDILAQQIAAA